MNEIMNQNRVYLFILIDNIDPSSLILGTGLSQISMEGSADDDIIQTVSVHVQNGDGVAEVSSNLSSGQIVKLKETTAGQENNLEKAMSHVRDCGFLNLILRMNHNFVVHLHFNE